MKKNFLQDVVPPAQKRSIRDVPLPRSRREFTQNPNQDSNPRFMDDRPIEDVYHNRPTVVPPTHHDPVEGDGWGHDDIPPKRVLKKIVIGVVAFLLIGLIFVVSRSNAEVKIAVKKENVFVSNSYDIYSDSQLDKPEGSLAYKKASVEKTASVAVSATGEEEVQQKASGKIKIENSYTEEKQALVATTRFEAQNGLVYRIAENVEVPGVKDGKPGTLEVEVFADKAGNKYNQEKTTFTIPGFEGLPQFEKITAQSATDLSGGFSGVKKIVNEQDKEVAVVSLKETLKTQIGEEIENNNQFITAFLEEDISYSSVKENDSGNQVELSITATADVFVFEKKSFSSFIASMNIAEAQGQDLMITNLDSLDYKVEEAEEDKLKIFVGGDIDFDWIVDTDKLKSDLEGRNRSQLKEILDGHKGVNRAEAAISPFWKSKFPEAKKIDVVFEE
jgi:hypothetical protein